jgi:metal-responsive CopG/Arc/MetJ family transcriptional regulator
MSQFVISIPNEFLDPLDELVVKTGAGSREMWFKQTIGNILIEYQVRKDLDAQIQQRTKYLASLWR